MIVDDPADWLGLDDIERQLVDFRVRLGREVRHRREQSQLTQAELAKAIGSSQSRIAKPEGTADGVGIDFLMRAFFATGVANWGVGVHLEFILIEK
jgi:transcriptional regulator with XRE-family HTH domain